MAPIPPMKDIKINTLKWEKQVVEILHPYWCYFNDSHLTNKIKATYEGETLNGIPHGWGRLAYTDVEDKSLSFSGWVHMEQGRLHNGAAIFERGDGYRYVFSHMHEGRPKGMGKWYRNDVEKGNVKSKKAKMDIGGWPWYVGDFNDGWWHGQGKVFKLDG